MPHIPFSCISGAWENPTCRLLLAGSTLGVSPCSGYLVQRPGSCPQVSVPLPHPGAMGSFLAVPPDTLVGKSQAAPGPPGGPERRRGSLLQGVSVLVGSVSQAGTTRQPLKAGKPTAVPPVHLTSKTPGCTSGPRLEGAMQRGGAGKRLLVQPEPSPTPEAAEGGGRGVHAGPLPQREMPQGL